MERLKTNIVPFDGPLEAEMCFIGEAPGAEEDSALKPFVGAAGQLLDRCFRTVGIARSEVLLGNIFRQRPPKNYINYYFQTDDLPDIKEGIKTCKRNLGDYKEKLDEFFKESKAYSDKELAKAIKTSEGNVGKLLKWYARLDLGEQILKCVKKQDECSFDAEL